MSGDPAGRNCSRLLALAPCPDKSENPSDITIQGNINRMKQGKILKYFLCCTLIGLSIQSVMAQQNVPGKAQLLNESWKFHPGHAADPSKDFNYGTAVLYAKTNENFGTCLMADFDDSNWETVQLPHDWVVEFPFVNSDNPDIKSH